MIHGYARVSTDGQSVDAQMKALRTVRAEFGRELIRARTAEDRERAKAQGVHMWRPTALTRNQLEVAREALAKGKATQADVTQITISRICALGATYG